MNFKKYLLLFSILALSTESYSQVGIGTTEPSPAAMLEVSSQTNGTGDYKGFMPPRVPDVDARNSIPVSAADDGLMVYVQDIGCLQIWDGSGWENIKCIPPPPIWPAIHNFEMVAPGFELPLYSANNGNYTTGNGQYPNTPLYVSPIRGYKVSNNTATLIF